MNWVKELFETIDSKIKSPILGSVLFAFVLLNWKALFFLVFAKVTVLEKFIFFDENTTPITLIVVPLLVGILISFLNPWVKLIALNLTKKPIQNFRITQMHLANERLIEKQKLEKARNDLLASKENTLIEAAKRTEEIGKIENTQIREELSKSIEDLRAEINMGGLLPVQDNPTKSNFSLAEQIKALEKLLLDYERQLEANQFNSNIRIDLEEKVAEVRQRLHDLVMGSNLS